MSEIQAFSLADPATLTAHGFLNSGFGYWSASDQVLEKFNLLSEWAHSCNTACVCARARTHTRAHRERERENQ
jgi:hypothetical protein